MKKFRGSVIVALAAALAVTSFNITPVQAASAGQQEAKPAVTVDLSARSRHHRYYRSNRGGQRAAVAMFGMMMGTMAAMAARDRYRDRGYYYGPRR